MPPARRLIELVLSLELKEVKVKLMLVSLVFQLKPEKNGTIPVTNGQHLHGIFFDKLLAQLEPALSDKLHTEKQKPFTLSNIQPVERQSGDKQSISLHSSQTYWFRLTGLNPWFSNYLLTGFREKLTTQPGVWPLKIDNIFGHTFNVIQILKRPEQHLWAAQIDYPLLTKAGQLSYLKQRNSNSTSNSKKVSRVRLNFCSPALITLAKEGIPNATQLIPSSRSIFGELARRWSIFSGEQLDRESFQQELDDKVIISAYELATEQIWLKSPQVCFRGWCEYSSFSDNPDFNSLLHTMSLFAFFAGVGGKSAMGCGQVRPDNLEFLKI